MSTDEAGMFSNQAGTPPASEDIDRYLSGESPLAERVRIEGWAEQQSEGDRVVMRLPDVLRGRSATSGNLEEVSPDQIAARAATIVAATSSIRSGARRPAWWRIPLVGTVTLALLALMLIGPGHTSFHITSRETRVVTTHIGQRAIVWVNPGVRAELAPSTMLRIRDDEVVLLGEAFFTVMGHHPMPFVVRTGHVTTRVLGTAFGVRRYADDHDTRVVVTEGKVATGGLTSITVSAGHLARVTDSTATSRIVTDLTPYTNWTTGRLDFHDTPARDVLDAVSRWYGLTFRLADSTLAAERIDARFDGQSTADVLAALRTVLDVTITVEGSTVTLHSRTSFPATPHNRREVRDSFSTIHQLGR